MPRLEPPCSLHPCRMRLIIAGDRDVHDIQLGLGDLAFDVVHCLETGGEGVYERGPSRLCDAIYVRYANLMMYLKTRPRDRTVGRFSWKKRREHRLPNTCRRVGITWMPYSANQMHPDSADNLDADDKPTTHGRWFARGKITAFFHRLFNLIL